MADNPYLDLAQEDVSGRLVPGQARDNPYMAIAKEDEQRDNQRLMQNLAQAAKQNPNQAGEAQRISQKTGMPSGLVQTDLDEMKRQAYLQDVQQRRLATTNPILARQLQDPEFAAIAHDQIDQLSGIEGIFQRLSEVPHNISTQFMAGRLQAEQGLLGYDKMAGTFGKDQKQRLDAVTEELRKSYAGDKTLEGNVASLVGQMSYTLPEVWTFAGATGLGFGAMGAMVGGPLTEVTGPSAAALGMTIGGAYKSSEMAMKQEAGGAYLDMIQEGINPKTATYAATGVGLINAALEVLSFGVVTAPFRKYAARKIGVEVAESLAKPTMRSALVEFGKKYIEAIGSESATEVLQEISSIAGEEIATTVDGLKTKISTPEGQQELFDRLIEIARKTAEGMSVVGIVGPSFNLRHDYKRAKVAERQAEFFTNLNQAADNEIVKRNPVAYQRFLQAQANGAAVENVYIDPEQFVNVLGQSQVTREQIDQVIPGISAQIDEAVATGSDIVIPTGEYGTKVAGTDLGNALLPHVKLTPDAFSMVEAEAFQKEKEQMLSDAAELLKEKSETEQAFVDSAREVKGLIEEEIKATGIYRDDEVRTMATMAQAMYVTKAAEMGMTPKELYDRFKNPVVLSGQQPAGAVMLSQEQTKSQEFLDKFRGSFAVSEDGSPLVLYHGTNARLIKQAAEQGRRGGEIGEAYLSESRDMADEYAGNEDGSAVTEYYGVFKNPQNGDDVVYEDTYEEDWPTAAKQLPYEELKKNIASLVKGSSSLSVNGLRSPTYAQMAAAFPEDWSALSDKYGIDGMVYRDNEGHGVTWVARSSDQLIERRPTSSNNIMAQSTSRMFSGMSGHAQQLPATIDVDGVQRPTMNSNGRPIHPTEEGVRNFWKWFGDSKVVDKQGRPLVVYHGTGSVFDEFKTEELGRTTAAVSAKKGFFFSENPYDSSSYVLPSIIHLNGHIDIDPIAVILGKGDDSKRLDEIYSKYKDERDWSEAEVERLLPKSILFTEKRQEKQVFDVVYDINNVLPITLPIQKTIDSSGNVEVYIGEIPVGRLFKSGSSMLFDSFINGNFRKLKDGVAEYLFAEKIGVPVMQVYLKAKSIKILDNNKRKIRIGDSASRKKGTDATRFLNIEDPLKSNHWIVYTPDQIKSATGNRGEFSPNDASILRQLSGHAQQLPATIDVDGVQRPTMNSNGRPIHPTEEGIRNFWKWFGDSKVVDEQGRPLVVYHGTSESFDVFDKKKIGTTYGTDKKGFFFSTDPAKATTAAVDNESALSKPTPYGGRNLMPVNLKAENPLTIKTDGDASNYFDESKNSLLRKAKKGKNDSIIIEGGNGQKDIIVFFPDQVKSTTGNRGEFSPNDASILRQLSGKWYYSALQRAFESAKQESMPGNQWAQWLAGNAGKIGVKQDEIRWTGLGDWLMLRGKEKVTKQEIVEYLQQSGVQAQLDQNRRGGFDPRTMTTILSQQSDLSTYLHESGHFYLEFMSRLAAMPEATEQMKADMQAILDWFGVADLATWQAMSLEEQRKYHEQWAYNYEIYLSEGKAPSVKLQKIFDRFSQWMRRVYKSIRDDLNEVFRAEHGTDLPVLTGEVRQVMDRMLASEEEIKQAESVRNMAPMFQDQQQSGMDDATWAAYQDMLQEARDSAVTDLTAASIRQLKWLGNARSRILKALQKESETTRKEVRAEVAEEVRSEPVYRAEKFIRKGELDLSADASRDARRTSIDLGMGGSRKLDRDAVREMFGEEDDIWKTFGEKGKVGLMGPNGLHPDIVAEMVGFDSGHALVIALANSRPINEVIEERTDERMMAEHSEMNDPAARELAVEQALHNEARARFVAVELRFLSKATAPVKIFTAAAKQVAKQIISGKRIGDIRPRDYSMAEARAARDAERAMKAGDPAAAVARKQAQLLQNHLASQAVEARQFVAKSLDYLKRIQNDAARKRIGADYADQIQALLYRFGLAADMPIGDRLTLGQWLDAQEESGFAPDLADYLVDERYSKPVKEMTLSEFEDLVDAAKQIYHIGKSQQKLLTSAKSAEYMAARDEIVASIEENAGDRTAKTRTPTTNLGRIEKGLKKFWAAHIKAAMAARMLDGGKDAGPLWEYLIRPANERADMETRTRAEATEALTKILEPVFKQGRMGGKGRYFPSIGRSLNRESVFTIALNCGNAGNMQRLLDGEGWTIGQVMPILETLTSDDLDAVQKIWDHFESYRPMIAAKERRVYGKEPKWIEPTSITIKSVTLAGGYYPVVYDAVASQRSEEFADAEQAKRDLRGAFTSATTRRSFTKSRAEKVVDRPLVYTLSGLYNGVNEVIHDLAWHEWLIDANRLLRSKSIDNAIRSHYGDEFKGIFKSWAKDIAGGDRRADNEAALSWIRQGVSAAGLGFNVMNAILQVTGFTGSIVRVGAKWIGRGVYLAGKDIRTASKDVNEKSDFMADRSRTQMRELADLRNRVQDETDIERRIKTGKYLMMMGMQRVVDVPTWLGAYEKAIVNEGHDEKTAVALADQAVRDSQGSGLTSDLSAIERGGPAMKLFTVFYSYMNTVFNLGVTSAMTQKSKGKLAADMLLLYVVPVILNKAIKDALTPNDGDDDEWDMGKIARELISEELSFLMGNMVLAREISDIPGIFLHTNNGRGYSGPAGLRNITELHTFSQQAAKWEFDDAFRKTAINLVGNFTGLPSAQINRTLSGAKALQEGKTSNPMALLFGVQ